MNRKLFHDPRGGRPLEISTYLHCSLCIQELPESESPASYARLAVGIQPGGAIQVWCQRHERNVDVMSFTPPPGLDFEMEEPRCEICGG